MRIRLREGKQKELVERVKEEGGYTWSELATILNISKVYLRNELRKEVRTLPSRIFKKLCELIDENYQKFVEEKLPSNWGQKKGGAHSKGRNRKSINFPEKSSRLAEFVGVMLGDGNIFSKTYPDTTVNCIRIAGNLKNEKSYLLYFIRPMLNSLFEVNPSVYTNSKNNEILLAVHGKELIRFTKEIGLSPGDKIENQATIPAWVFEEENFLKACIRGLIDTDGTIYSLKPHYPNLLQISFKNNNRQLLRDFRKAFQKLGYHPSRISSRNVYLSRQEEIKRYMDEINFNNPKNRNRYSEAR